MEDRSGSLAPPTEEAYPERPYRDSLFAFQTTLPAGWVATVTTEPDLPRTVNLLPADRPTSDRAAPSPPAVRKGAHVLAVPDGLGTEIPPGHGQAWLAATQSQGYTGFPVDESRSQVFRLDDGEVWANLLYPATPPGGWSDDGFVFVQYAVETGSTRYHGAGSGSKAPRDGDTIGSDERVRGGRVSDASRSAVALILNNWEFTEGSGRALDDLIRVDTPVPQMKLTSPLTVSGGARGPYFFEGTFTVRLEDREGNKLAEVPATAQTDWMTEDWVPFRATLTFIAPEGGTGRVVFERANPSGLEENARRLVVPVRF